MMDYSKRTGPAVEAHYQFLLWLIPAVERRAKNSCSATVSLVSVLMCSNHLSRLPSPIKSKRKKPGAASFFANLESELLALERQLRDGSYRPGRYVAFEVHDPKQRIVSAAPFRDRVVHHALCAVVEPIFEEGFIDHTFADRVGKGTHRAVAAYEGYRNRYAYVLRCDIYRYFPAIDHAVLKTDFRRRISCQSVLALLDLVVDASNPQEPIHLYFDGDDLFEPFRRRRGLPIGNLTSQFFANLYLDGFDHFVTEVLQAPYLRYVDDFALFNDDLAVLAEWRLRIERFLARRRLKLHPRKTMILSCRKPVQFLGFELHPGRSSPPRGQCAPLPQPPARPARPLAGGSDHPRQCRCSCARLDRSR
jgi:RNA-directed DNA polymerase